MSTFREVGPGDPPPAPRKKTYEPPEVRDYGKQPPPIANEDGELVEEAGPRRAVEAGVLAQLNASEIDRMVAYARADPRSLTGFRDEVTNLVVQDVETAASCIYALPRGKELNPVTKRWEKKIVTGPTARFAEIVAFAWRNNRYGARMIDIGAETVTAQGVFFDLERNVSVSIDVQHSILDSNNKRYNADMVNMTCNAVLSVATRNAILKAVPKALWKGLLQAAQQTITGTRKTLHARRVELVSQFKAFNMDEPTVSRILGVEGIADITLEHLAVLNGILTSLRDGETTVEDLLAQAEPTVPRPPTKSQLDDRKQQEIAEAERKRQQRRDTMKADSKPPTPVSDIKPSEPVQETLGQEMKDW